MWLRNSLFDIRNSLFDIRNPLFDIRNSTFAHCRAIAIDRRPEEIATPSAEDDRISLGSSAARFGPT